MLALCMMILLLGIAYECLLVDPGMPGALVEARWRTQRQLELDAVRPRALPEGDR